MPINKEFSTSVTGTYDQSGASWSQPDAFARPKGMDLTVWKADSTCSAYNSATVILQLQGTVDGSASSLPTDSDDWEVIAELRFTANGATYAANGSSGLLSTRRYRFLRVVHSLSGTPSADVTCVSSITADYLG